MCVYFCVTMSCRCDPQEATNCEEEAEKGPKTGVRSSAKLLQLRRTSVEKKPSSPRNLIACRGCGDRSNKLDVGCAKWIQLIIMAAFGTTLSRKAEQRKAEIHRK